RRIAFVVAQIFKRENGNSVRQGTRDKFTFPNNPARSCRQCHQRRCKYRAGWIAPHPFLSSRENSRMPRLNRFILYPTVEIFRKRQSGSVSTLWIFLDAFK